jgi:uncharacterized protein YjbI with pentapeptide repeats
MPDSSSSQPSRFTPLENQTFSATHPQAEAHPLLESQTLLLENIKQGDIDALKQYLDLKLAPYQARVEDIGIRKEQLQLSLSGPEVPNQEIFEPLLQTWTVQLELFQFSTIELYGQRDGSTLPFWRCSFNPKDVDLNRLSVSNTSEVLPSTGFIDPLQVDFKGGAGDHSPEDLSKASALEIASNNPLSAVSETPTSAHVEDKDELGLGGEEEAILESQHLSEVTSQEKTKAVKDFLAQYTAGERDFAKIQLNEADLSRVNLTLANLHGAELIWTNLTEANLYHIDLSSAKLRHANLSGAMLRSSNLQGTDFLNANLRGADLSWSNLNGANLTGADLTDANLKNAILERVILPDGTLLD